MIVLNPFSDSLCNSAFKNIDLTLRTGLGCFQSSQDIVLDLQTNGTHIASAILIIAMVRVVLRSLPYCFYGSHLEVSLSNYKQCMKETKMLESNHFTYSNTT